MRQDKLRYKLAIRSKAAASANDFADTLNDAQRHEWFLEELEIKI